jgi:DnaD/phage-associated family protein
LNKLLLDEKPLIVLPSLAKAIGLNEAIILQQLHYWLQESNNIRDGYKWVYNTYEDWQKQFPFWSKNTIIRAIKSLEKMGLVVVGNYNKMKIDNTKWYRIDYEKLEGLGRPSTQNEQTEYPKWVDREPNLSKPITREYTENTTENVVVEETENDVDILDLLEKIDEKTRKEIEKIARFYQEKFEPSMPTKTMKNIIQWVDRLSPELVFEALKITLKEGKKWNYAKGILNNWLKDGITSLNDLEKQKEKKSAPRRRSKADVWDAFSDYINSLGDEEDE